MQIHWRTDDESRDDQYVLAKNVAYPSLASSTALIDTRDQGAVRSRNAAYESCTLRVISPRAASSPSTSAETLRAASTTSRGKLLSCTLCRSISAASASALSRSISASAKFASAAQACATTALPSPSSASQAFSDTMHSPVPFGLLKPG